MLESLCLAQLTVTTHVLQIIENSGNTCSHHHSLLFLLSAKICLLGIRSCHHGQPVAL
jgi:hypothetical protein